MENQVVWPLFFRYSEHPFYFLIEIYNSKEAALEVAKKNTRR